MQRHLTEKVCEDKNELEFSFNNLDSPKEKFGTRTNTVKPLNLPRRSTQQIQNDSQRQVEFYMERVTTPNASIRESSNADNEMVVDPSSTGGQRN